MFFVFAMFNDQMKNHFIQEDDPPNKIAPIKRWSNSKWSCWEWCCKIKTLDGAFLWGSSVTGAFRRSKVNQTWERCSSVSDFFFLFIVSTFLSNDTEGQEICTMSVMASSQTILSFLASFVAIVVAGAFIGHPSCILLVEE